MKNSKRTKDLIREQEDSVSQVNLYLIASFYGDSNVN